MEIVSGAEALRQGGSDESDELSDTLEDRDAEVLATPVANG